MTEDITSLQIRILYDKVVEAEKKLNELDAAGKKVEKGMKAQEGAAASLMKKLAGMAAAYISVTALVGQFNSAIATTREFQILRAQVQTATGSLENMEEAWAALVDFARETPYALEDSVAAFVNLVNLGLTPSERALRSYGDTAAALGGSIVDMAQAVAKATAGEFEPLRKYGITAKQTEQDITFSFRGIKTTVKKSIDDIEGYFIKLGENNFAGAMAERMKTLDGQFSNLEDSWAQLQYDFMTSTGAADLFGDALSGLSEMLGEFSAYINSGELALDFESWTVGFQGFITEVELGLQSIGESVGISSDDFKSSFTETFDEIGNGVKALPSTVKATVQTISTILWALVDSAEEIGKAVYATIAASFRALVNAAWNTGKAMANALNPFSNQSAAGGFQDAWAGLTYDLKKGAGESRKAWEDSFNKININADVATANIKDSWAEAQNEINRSAELAAQADAKRQQYDADAEKRAKERTERLAKYRAAGAGGGVDPSGSDKKGKKGGGMSEAEREWERLEEDLRKEEELIAESYERRMKLIEDNTRQGSKYQAELEVSLTEKFQEEQLKRLEAMKKEPETMFQAFAEEEKILEESYERRKQIILDATELTEEERLKMLEEAETAYTIAMRKHETERNKMTLGLAEDFFGNLATIAGAFGKKGAKIAKAAAIAQTTIKTYEAATSAYASLAGIPYVGPALGVAAAAAAVAAGMANIAKIRSQDEGNAGAYASGGIVGGNSFLGDRLTASVNTGEAIFNKGQQKQLWDMANGRGGSGGGVTVNVHNAPPGTEVRETEGLDGKVVDIIIGRAVEASREAIATDIHKGGTKVARAMETRYGTTRVRR